MKEKLNKKDILYVIILILGVLILMISYSRFKYVYGSVTDWKEQHTVIPDCFRQLFYQTKQIFPSFAPNIGGGQNIYYFSYYGLLNPIILISYLIPFVSMQNYIIVSTAILVFVSVILVYLWLRRRYEPTVAFMAAVAFMCAGPFIFHSHRHIMFINYFPFLIASFMCIDKGIKNRRLVLFPVFLFLIIMTSYFFSFSALIFITAYALAVYLENNCNKLVSKEHIKRISIYFLMVFIGIMLAGVLLLPTINVLVHGRVANGMSGDIIKMVCPGFNLQYIIYSPYSAGVTFIGMVSFIAGLFSKNRRTRFLSFCIITPMFFSVFLYLLNGTLYVDGKVTIPFLPIAVMLIADMIENIKLRKINIIAVTFAVIWGVLNLFFRHMSYYIPLFLADALMTTITMLWVGKKGIRIYRMIPLFSMMFVICIFVNNQDVSVLKEEQNNSSEKSVSKLIDQIPQSDENVYRTSNMCNPLDNVNKIYKSDYYQSTLYSSAFNPYFHNFYFESIGNETRYRNASIMSPSLNIIYNIYMSNRYLIFRGFPPIGYTKIAQEDGISLYENSNVFPLAYSSGKVMSSMEYETLPYPQKIESILEYAVIDDDKLPESGFKSHIESWLPQFDYNPDNDPDNIIKEQNGVYMIKNKADNKLDLKLKDPVKDKIIFIKFHVDNTNNPIKKDVFVKINQIKNKLTTKEWKYYNNNEWFEYVISSEEKISNLEVTLSEGEYSISDIRMYVLDYSQISSLKDSLDIMKIDKQRTLGDTITGSIDMSRDGLLQMSIPYDKGFHIYVDGKEQEYIKVDTAFIGTYITKGKHEIQVVFKAPLRIQGIICSFVGLLMLTSLVIYTIIAKKKKS